MESWADILPPAQLYILFSVTVAAAVAVSNLQRPKRWEVIGVLTLSVLALVQLLFYFLSRAQNGTGWALVHVVTLVGLFGLMTSMCVRAHRLTEDRDGRWEPDASIHLGSPSPPEDSPEHSNPRSG